MKTVILSAFLAAVSAHGYAADDPKPNPQQEQAAPASVKATIPAVMPADAGRSVPDTDPIKMAAPPEGTKHAVPPEFENTYVIGPEDQLSIVVWGNRDLTGSYVVAPDGRISVPLINEILVAKMTRLQVQDEVTRRLKEGGFLRDPTVSVNVTGFNSKKYSIQGEVFKPGSSPLVIPTTVLTALVNAGGFKDFANKSSIRILRDNGKKVFRFNYNQVVNGKHLEQNILLEPGDLIIVK